MSGGRSRRRVQKADRSVVTSSGILVLVVVVLVVGVVALGAVSTTVRIGDSVKIVVPCLMSRVAKRPSPIAVPVERTMTISEDGVAAAAFVFLTS